MNYSLRIGCFFLLANLFSSCLAQNQKKASVTRINELEEVNSSLASAIDSLKLDAREDSIRMNFLVDSLGKEISRLHSFVSIDSININDALRYRLDSLSNRVSIIENSNRRLQIKLHKLKQQFAEIYQLSGTKAVQVRTPQSVYDCYEVNLKETNLSLFWQNEKGEPLRNIDALQKHLDRKGKHLVFAMNAGMYKRDNSPQGLFIQDGKELVPIDRRKEEYGNFYMQPNGVFLIDTTNSASLIITDQFDSVDLKKAVFATQSGPMVLIDGEVNEKFNEKSNSKHIRNGVGIIDKNNIVFVISNKQVNLYDFANVFKEHFNCSNALYLDGAISRMYLPEIQRLQKGGDFGPIIGIYK